MPGNEEKSNRPQFTFSTNGRVYGFDSLFHDGRLVWTKEHPFVMVIWGPEGSGKSTLALELSCLGQVTAVTQEEPPSESEPPAPILTRCVLYYVTDAMAEPRIQQKYDEFLKPSEGTYDERSKLCEPRTHPVQLRDWDKDRRPVFGKTSLFIRRYNGAHQIDRLTQFIRNDIEQVLGCIRKTPGAAAVDEFTVVVDGIAGFELPKEAGAPAASEETPASPKKEAPVLTIWSSVVIPLATQPLVVILVDELEGRTVYHDRDPYLANVYIKLWQGEHRDIVREKGYCERYLQVVKAATSPHVRGPQIFRIQPETGVEVHPSLIAYYGLLRRVHREQRDTDTSCADGARYVRFGHDDLDGVLEDRYEVGGCGGAIQAGSCNLLIGDSGTYKTPLALHFAHRAHTDKEKAIFLSFHDHVRTLRQFLERMGFAEGNLPDTPWLYERRFPDPVRCDDVKSHHQCILQQMTSWFTPPEVFMSMLKALFERMDIGPDRPHKCRIVFDAVSDLNMSYPRLTGRRGFLAVLVNTLRVYGLTSLFVFNEGAVESSEDKVIVSLADNIFHMHKRSIAGKSSTILHVEQLGNRLPRYTGVMHVRREHVREKPDAPGETENKLIETIVIKKSLEAYRLDQNNEFVPAAIKLYVNRRADAHEIFNRAICKAHRLPDEQLNQDLAIQRGEAYRQNIENLRINEDSSVIMAIDEDCLCEENLKKFIPLEEKEIDGEGFRARDTAPEDERTIEGRFCNVKACKVDIGTEDESIRVLPSLVDCTVLTCNVRILNELSKAETPAMRIIEDIIKGAIEQIGVDAGKRRDDTKYSRWDNLPPIPWQLVQEASKEFYEVIRDRSYRFLGFATSEEFEALIVLFVDLLHSRGIIRNCKDTEPAKPKHEISTDDIGSIARVLKIASDLYLGCFPYCPKGEETADNCLFYYTWHSILYSGSQERLVPLRTIAVDDWGKIRNTLVPGGTGTNSCFEKLRPIANAGSQSDVGPWRFTKGGYYWGILDNGLAGERVRKVLEYSLSEAMNLFRVKVRVGMPPRKKFHVDTGDLSIYNLRLMRDVFDKAWSRTWYPNYHCMAFYIRAFLSEYLEYLKRNKPISNEEEHKRWLENFLPTVLRHVQDENYR